MIPGFNTDIKFQGKVYHVQTEDKGKDNPIFESLVYVGGAILAAKRTSYAEELKRGITDEELASRLERQHKIILAAIQKGKIDTLTKAQTSSLPETVADTLPQESTFCSSSTQEVIIEESSFSTQEAIIEEGAEAASVAQFEPAALIPPSSQIELAELASPEAQAEPAPPSLEESSTPVEPVARRPVEPQPQVKVNLEIELRGIDEFIAGECYCLKVAVKRNSRTPAKNTQVIVKILSTTFKPHIMTERTGADGLAIFTVEIPEFRSGSAALVVQVLAEFGEGERRFPIRRRQ